MPNAPKRRHCAEHPDLSAHREPAYLDDDDDDDNVGTLVVE